MQKMKLESDHERARNESKQLDGPEIPTLDQKFQAAHREEEETDWNVGRLTPTGRTPPSAHIQRVRLLVLAKAYQPWYSVFLSHISPETNQ